MSAGGSSIKDDGWLASIMERPVFRVDATSENIVADLRAHMASHATCSAPEGSYYFAKVDSKEVALTKALLGVGFFVADVNVTFAVAPSKVVGAPSPKVEVGTLPAGASAAKDEVLAVAHDSFRFTRFHLDPLVSRATADLVKKEWVRNYAEGKRGDHLFVAMLDGRAVGFLAALKTADNSTAIIDLVGVGPNAQRQGVGRTMIARFAEHYRDCKKLLVGTQVANIPSVQLYESMGFRLESSQYVLHMHVRNGAVL